MKQTIFILIFSLHFLLAFSYDVDSLTVELEKATSDTHKISLLHKISWELKTSDPGKAFELAIKGYNLANTINDKKGAESCLNNLGVIKAMTGDFDESIEFFNQNLELNKELKNIEGEATANNNLGLVYYYKGDFAKAVEHYIITLNLYDDLDDEANKASAYNNLGLIYENKTDYDKALEYQYKALKIREEIKDEQQLAFSYGNIGNVYFLKEDYEAALEYFFKAEPLFEKVNDQRSIAMLVGNIGKIYVRKEQYDKAIPFYERGLKIQEKINDKYGIAVNLLNISEVNSVIGNWEKSIVYGERGILLANKIGAKDVLKQGYGSLRTSYFESGNLNKAYYYQEKLLNLKDSLFNVEKQDKIAELETKYQSAQKEKENELLRKSNAINELKLNKSKIINYGVTGILLIISILGLFIYKGYSDKKKALVLLEVKNSEITHQKNIIEKKNKDVLDSLNYAKRIQYAILPPQNYVNELLPNSFIFYQPKDIVSGDFYWIERFKNRILFAAVDCTGHGVPGAFMSIVGYNGLNQALNETDGKPSTILNYLNDLVSNTLHQTQNTDIKEGMDISLCALDLQHMTLEYAGAYNSIFIVRNNNVIEKKGYRFSIGSKHYRGDKVFENQTIKLQKEDVIYTTTDGYLDQFGGDNNRKFNKVNFKKLMISQSVDLPGEVGPGRPGAGNTQYSIFNRQYSISNERPG